MTYDCMTAEELALWQDSPYTRATVPCSDCPVSFYLQEKAAGRCNLARDRRNRRNRSYRAKLNAEVRGVRAILQHQRQADLRREYNREWMRSYRASQRASVVGQ